VVRKLDNPHLTVNTDAACDQAARFETVAILGIEAVIAVIRLGDFKGAVERRGAGARNNCDGLQLAYKRASQARNHEGLWLLVPVFFVIGVLKPQDVARELDDRVLKPPSGPYERDPAFAGEHDRA
jgi:hypothetical protein